MGYDLKYTLKYKYPTGEIKCSVRAHMHPHMDHKHTSEHFSQRTISKYNHETLR
jgi:hypothetical protein